MTHFQFRLASVLRLREAQLGVEKNKLAQLLSELNRLERSLASVGEERSEALAFVRGQSHPGAAEFRALSAFLIGSDARAAALRASIERLQPSIARQRADVLAADRKVRLLLKLRDRRLAEWQFETDRKLEAIAQDAWLAAHRQTD